MPGGIFCIENWSGSLASQDTVRPLLDFLERDKTARVIHQRVGTTRELRHYLARFTDLTTYPIGYLAMHGTRGKVLVGPESLTIEDLIQWFDEDGRPPALGATDAADDLSEWVFDLKGKILYLGSCDSLKVSPDRLAAMREHTGAIAVCGYTRSVDWYESAGFDVLLLSAFAAAMDTKTPRASLAAKIKRIRKRVGGQFLDETLGFVCEPDWQ